jgi:hypothetical protein
MVPKIAGGSGSITDLKLNLDRRFSYKGKRISPFTASCPDRRFAVREQAIFGDSSQTGALEFARLCVPRD